MWQGNVYLFVEVFIKVMNVLMTFQGEDSVHVFIVSQLQIGIHETGSLKKKNVYCLKNLTLPDKLHHTTATLM